jgi:hypothetical protein
LLTGWWWPGIMVVLGISGAAGLIFRGRYLSALTTALVFFSIPLLVAVDISWLTVGPLILIGLAIVGLVKAIEPAAA